MMPPPRLSFLHILACSSALLTMGSAQADCSPPTAATTYPHAAAAIAAWESARGVRVASDTKERILTQFCKSSENLAVSDALKPAEVDAKAQEAIKDYLDRQVDPSVPGRTMGATLRGLFGHHGFSQPVIKPDGLIEITYAHAGVDRLSIGAYTVDPAPKFLVPTGKVTVIGYTKNAEVCRISTMVSTTQPATVTC